MEYDVLYSKDYGIMRGMTEEEGELVGLSCEEVLDWVFAKINSRKINERRVKNGMSLALAAIDFSKRMTLTLEVRRYKDRLTAVFKSLVFAAFGVTARELARLIGNFDEVTVYTGKDGMINIDLDYYFYDGD